MLAGDVRNNAPRRGSHVLDQQLGAPDGAMLERRVRWIPEIEQASSCVTTLNEVDEISLHGSAASTTLLRVFDKAWRVIMRWPITELSARAELDLARVETVVSLFEGMTTAIRHRSWVPKFLELPSRSALKVLLLDPRVYESPQKRWSKLAHLMRSSGQVFEARVSYTRWVKTGGPDHAQERRLRQGSRKVKVDLTGKISGDKVRVFDGKELKEVTLRVAPSAPFFLNIHGNEGLHVRTKVKVRTPLFKKASATALESARRADAAAKLANPKFLACGVRACSSTSMGNFWR